MRTNNIIRRIPVDRDLLRQDEVFPERIDYEKSVISYHIPLVTKEQTDTVPEALFAYGFNKSYSGPLNIVGCLNYEHSTNFIKR